MEGGGEREGWREGAREAGGERKERKSNTWKGKEE